MFLLVATALAGTTQVGWPCQRLNWGWRNVWSTCSINSFAPHVSAVENVPQQAPAFFRFASSPAVSNAPFALNGVGTFTPVTGGGTVPQFFCTNAAATGTGATATLRNRCRRAVDAYGSLVRQCQLPPLTAGNRVATHPMLPPDFAPASHHVPHVSNVAGLTQHAQLCQLPPWQQSSLSNLATPSNTCPGLLGWFTVVYNACGFTNAPALSPTTTSTLANLPLVHTYFPLGNSLSPSILSHDATPPALGVRSGVLCGAAVNPSTWNVAGGAQWRTSRCRRALDQFGRTAQRCHSSTTVGTGPSQAGGYSDPLRLFAVGGTGASPASPIQPLSLNVLAPVCN